MTPGPASNLRSGAALEQISDDINSANAAKGTFAGFEFDQAKDKSQFRRYEAASNRVKGFYLEQHQKQTVAFNIQARHEFRMQTRAIEHLLQTAEATRRDGKPPWMQLTGLIHDLGKLLYFHGAQGQWDVVGDTFPVGCAFEAHAIVYPGSFAANPDTHDPLYSSKYGIYAPACGLDNVMLSWGHDEYLYHICKDQSTLPAEALAMIRYHSFYPWHRHGGYKWMMNDKDHHMIKAVQAFNPYDLYSKSDDLPNVEELKPYYMKLIRQYFYNDRPIRW